MVFTEGYGDDGPGWVAIHRTVDEGFCDGSCEGAQSWVESSVKCRCCGDDGDGGDDDNDEAMTVRKPVGFKGVL